MPGEFTKGILRKNPIFILMVGLCPTLATTGSVESAFWMGVAASVVLVCSNTIISLIRDFIPKGVRIPCYIVVIASFVTMVELMMKAYLPPALNRTLGIFIPLIVVNCIILYRAEDFASRNGVFASILDGLGMGVGFMLALVLLGTVREFMGDGKITLPFHVPVLTILAPEWHVVWVKQFIFGFDRYSLMIMILAPGAFLVIGVMMGFFRLPLRQQRRLLLWVFLFPVMLVVTLAGQLASVSRPRPVPVTEGPAAGGGPDD